jgi:hypothetical protein
LRSGRFTDATFAVESDLPKFSHLEAPFSRLKNKVA